MVYHLVMSIRNKIWIVGAAALLLLFGAQVVGAQINSQSSFSPFAIFRTDIRAKNSGWGLTIGNATTTNATSTNLYSDIGTIPTLYGADSQLKIEYGLNGPSIDSVSGENLNLNSGLGNVNILGEAFMFTVNDGTPIDPPALINFNGGFKVVGKAYQDLVFGLYDNALNTLLEYYGSSGFLLFGADFQGSGHNISDFASISTSLYKGEDTDYVTTQGSYFNWRDTSENSLFDLDVGSGLLTLKNALKLKINSAGDDKNVQIYHDDTNTKIDSSSGDIIVNQEVRASTSLYRRYYHIPMTAVDPGLSGATWTTATANNMTGWQLNAATELLYFESDVHSDWNGTSDLTVEIKWQLLSAGSADDTVDLKLVAYYMGVGDIVTKSQTVKVPTTTDGTQYKMYKTTFTIDYDAASNVVDAGDSIDFVLNLETDTSEIGNVLIVDGSFSYQTTHLGIEAGDI